MKGETERELAHKTPVNILCWRLCWLTGNLHLPQWPIRVLESQLISDFYPSQLRQFRGVRVSSLWQSHLEIVLSLGGSIGHQVLPRSDFVLSRKNRSEV